MNNVSFQGEHGAYSESAAKKCFGREIETIPCKSFEETLKNTEEGKSDYAVLPVENSIEGTVGQSIDAITNTDLYSIGEVYLKIEHCLIGKGKLEDIDTVYSHPQALGQCNNLIQDKKWKTIPTYDTAGSVKIVKEMNDMKIASIASYDAGMLYDVPIIEQGIENNPNNFTRFLIFSKENSVKSSKDKTSIIFSVKHEPGALYNILKEFNDNEINLTKIESRPNKNTNWEYNFLVDFLGHFSNSKIETVLKKVTENTLFLKVLGSYPIADLD
tara:strand:- start:912 stop:1727 length:816 start_codon:yes stop_codon:yes gene_type:complete